MEEGKGGGAGGGGGCVHTKFAQLVAAGARKKHWRSMDWSTPEDAVKTALLHCVAVCCVALHQACNPAARQCLKDNSLNQAALIKIKRSTTV